MKRTIIVTSILTFGLVGGGVASALPGGPGPNGENNRGLCTAYFSGSENGQEHKRKAGPFQALEAAADAAGDGDGEATVEEVVSFCDSTAPGWGNNGTENPGGGGKGKNGGGGGGA